MRAWINETGHSGASTNEQDRVGNGFTGVQVLLNIGDRYDHVRQVHRNQYSKFGLLIDISMYCNRHLRRSRPAKRFEIKFSCCIVIRVANLVFFPLWIKYKVELILHFQTGKQHDLE